MNYTARKIDQFIHAFQVYVMCNPYAGTNYLTKKITSAPILSEVEVIGQLDQLIDGNESRAGWLNQEAQTRKREAVKLNNLGQRKQALLELKRAKKMEQMSFAIQKVNENVQNLGDNVQMTSINTQIAGVMSTAMNSIKQMKAQTSINTDEIDNLMDDMQDNQDDISEITNALSRPLESGFNNDDDDSLNEELSQELEELCKKDHQTHQQTHQIIYVPNQPSQQNNDNNNNNNQTSQKTIPANQAISLVRKKFNTNNINNNNNLQPKYHQKIALQPTQVPQHIQPPQPMLFPNVPNNSLCSNRLMAEQT